MDFAEEAAASGALAFFGDSIWRTTLRVVRIPDPRSPLAVSIRKSFAAGARCSASGDLGVPEIVSGNRSRMGCAASNLSPASAL